MTETSAMTTLSRLVHTAKTSGQPIPGHDHLRETPAMRRQREANEAQRHAEAAIRETLAKAELERLTASLQQRGEVAPMTRRTDAGHKVTEYIGSTRAFLAPFSEPLQKVNLGASESMKNARVRVAAQKEAARFEQLGRAMARGEV